MNFVNDTRKRQYFTPSHVRSMFFVLKWDSGKWHFEYSMSLSWYPHCYCYFSTEHSYKVHFVYMSYRRNMQSSRSVLKIIRFQLRTGDMINRHDNSRSTKIISRFRYDSTFSTSNTHVTSREQSTFREVLFKEQLFLRTEDCQ